MTTKTVTNPPNALPPEPRWPAIIALLAIAALYLSLPESLTAGPNWLLPAFAVLFLAGAVGAYQLGRMQLNRVLGFLSAGVLTAALAWALVTLIAGLPSKREAPTELLRSAVALWLSNLLVFASWYWRLDAGGPHARDSRPSHVEGAFLFPQMMMRTARAWRPGFVD